MSSVTAGRSSPSDSSSGAPIGGPASTAAAIADCQSSESTSTTAVGRSALPVAGNSALATPAASATASAPPTRIVLRVALDGEAELLGRLVVLRIDARAGAAGRSSSPSEQPPSRPSEQQRDGQATHGGAD